MVSLTSLGITSILILLVLGIVSQASAIGTSSDAFCTSKDTDVYCNNYRNMVTIQCHMPVWDGWDTSTSLNSNNNTFTFNGNGTYFDCGFNISGQFTARYPRTYTTANSFGIPTGWYFYTGDTLTQFFFKVSAIVQLFVSYVSPIGFNIFGFGIGDIGVIGLAIVIIIYALCYLFISILMYKTLSPFVSVH